MVAIEEYSRKAMDLALNDILNGLGKSADLATTIFWMATDGLGFGYNDNLNGLKDALPATAKMVNQKTLRLHKIFDLYKNLAFLQNVEFLTCVGNNVTFPIRRGQNHEIKKVDASSIVYTF